MSENSEPNASIIKIGPLGAAASYLALTFLQMLPLSLRFTTHLPAGRIDAWQNYWNFWWWKHCAWGLEGNPFHAKTLFHPIGAEAVFHTHSVFNMVFSAPINLMWGEAAAYNASLFFAVASAGFFTFLLVRDLTSNDAAAFLAGLIYAFLPQRMEFMMETLNLISSQFIPLTLLFFRRVAVRGGMGATLGLALSYVLNAYCDWHLGVKLTLLLLVCAGYFLWTRPRPALHLLRDWIIAGVLVIILLSPLLIPMVDSMTEGSNYFQKDQHNKGVDPAFLFLPHHHHFLWGALTAELYWRCNYEAEPGMGCFLGYSLIALNLVALTRNRRLARKWWVMFAATLLMALGAHLRIFNRTPHIVPLPFAALEHLPLLSLLRVASRFFILSGLAWGIISAFSAILLLKDSKKSWLILYALLMFEFAWVPFSTQRTPNLPGYEKIKADPTPGAVFDIPVPPGIRQSYNMQGQTIHERPIIGGYLSTKSDEWAKFDDTDPAVSNLNTYEPPLVTPFDLDALRQLGIAFIVLHRDRTTGLARMLREEDGPADIYQRRVNRARAGFPAEKFQIVYDEMVRQTGEPYFEDEDLIIFKIARE